MTEPAHPSSEKPDLWLIRTHQNRILGPFPAEEIRRRVINREIGPEDEVSHANTYWFALHEQAELGSQLGIELPPRVREDEEEVTDTETASLNMHPGRDVARSSEPGTDSMDGEEAGSGQWVRRTPGVRVEAAGDLDEPSRRFERMALLRYLALTLLFIAAFLFFLVWRILRSH